MVSVPRKRELDALVEKVDAHLLDHPSGGEPGPQGPQGEPGPQGPPGPAGSGTAVDRYDIVFNTGQPTGQIEDQMWDLMSSRKGGSVLFTGGNYNVTQPIDVPPGIIAHVEGYPNPYHSGSRTNFTRQFDAVKDPHGNVYGVFNFVAKSRYDWDAKGSAREAWWGREMVGFHVDGNGKSGPAFRQVGGNLGRYINLSAHDTQIGLQVWGDRPDEYDGQYSLFEGLRIRHRGIGIDYAKGSPDTTFRHGWVYGTMSPGTTGIKLAAGTGATTRSANNINFFDMHTQFNEVGLDVGSDNCYWFGGSWENKNGAPLISDNAYAVILRATVSGFVMNACDFANKTSVKNYFKIEDGARKYRFRDLTGHFDASDLQNLTNEQVSHFDLIPD